MNLVKDIIAIRSEDFYQFHGVLINGRKILCFIDKALHIGTASHENDAFSDYYILRHPFHWICVLRKQWGVDLGESVAIDPLLGKDKIFQLMMEDIEKIMHGFCDESEDIGHMVWRKVM